MSNHTQANPSSTQPGVGVLKTAHGIGENVRGRTLGVIDDITGSGSPEDKSRYSSMADRGRMEVETGMARIYGYPDPNAANVPHNEPGRPPQSNPGTFGNDHTTGTGPGKGYMRTGENDDHSYGGSNNDSYGGSNNDSHGGNNRDSYGRGGDVHGGVGKGAGGYGTDGGYGQPGAQNLERQQPAIDGNRDSEMGPDPSGRGSLSPNRSPQNAVPERMKQDPPELPPRAPAQAADNDQATQMHQ